MVNRILALIKQKGMSVSAVEKELHFGNGAIKRFNSSSPSIDKIIALSNFLNVSIDYLVYGDENELSTHEKITDIEAKLLLDFRSLSSQGQEYIRQTMFMAKEVYKKPDIFEANLNAG